MGINQNVDREEMLKNEVLTSFTTFNLSLSCGPHAVQEVQGLKLSFQIVGT